MVIDLDKIKEIESSGNPKAYNKKSQAAGLFQVTPILLKEWNNFHCKEQYFCSDLFDPKINKKIASWYLNIRIPEMLKAYKLEVSDKNILWAYNAGIDRVKKGFMPEETENYLKKYFAV